MFAKSALHVVLKGSALSYGICTGPALLFRADYLFFCIVSFVDKLVPEGDCAKSPIFVGDKHNSSCPCVQADTYASILSEDLGTAFFVLRS